MDFMTCLLEWEGTNAIFVVVNRLKKWVKFALNQTNATMVGMAILFFDTWVRHNGHSKWLGHEIHIRILDVINEQNKDQTKI
jgi:hypothetical protein